jgi:uncharacterized iron-regulated membrane protein
MSALERFGAAVDPLHFGDFGGLVSKLVWFIFGLALTGLAITGWSLTGAGWPER